MMMVVGVITAQEMMRSEQSIQTLSNTRACKQNGTNQGQFSNMDSCLSFSMNTL